MRAITLLAALALAGCAAAPPPQTVYQTRLQYVTPQVPADYKFTAPLPPVLVKPHIAANDPHGGSKAAKYIAQDDDYKIVLRAAASECVAKLYGLNAFLDAQAQAAAAANKGAQ